MNFFKIFFLILLFLLSITSNHFGQGFLRVNGDKIVNDVDQNFILKGMGLGGWLVQEGYMLNTPYSIMGAEHEIRNEIQKLVGAEKTNDLYEVYQKNYVRKIDVDSLAEWGFNSIRLPMHWNKLISEILPLTYNEEGFRTIDTLLTWCEENKIYLILDLHAAPGGQSDEPISDYDRTKLSLWESEVNKNITVDLWKTIAERYADKEWIGGYDLINEPKWDLGNENVPLRDLYIRITEAIRTVDQNHIIYIEGNWFATTFDGLMPPWDENMVYSFHKYWNQTDQGTINYLVNIRNTYNRPLWLGETGENSNDWFRENVELMADNNIGWAWWPHKKIDNISGPLSAPKVDGYQQLLNYWNGNGGKPNETVAYNVLLNQFNALKFENCKIQSNMYKSLFEPQPEVSIPFKSHEIPGTIFGSDYDYGGQLVGYNDKDYKNTGGGAYNSGYQYRNDGVDIEICSDVITNGFNIGWIESGEWLKFTVNVNNSGIYDMNFRVASPSNAGKFMLDIDDQNLIGFTDIPNTGDWKNWQTISVKNINLSEGEHILKIRFFFGGFNFNYMEITSSITNTDVQSFLPKKYQLFQNYPNPFNPNSKLKYNIPEFSEVSLTLYNSLGEKKKSLINSNQGAGNYEINVQGNELSSGIYFCELKASSLISTKKHKSLIKMVLLK
jgi:endoglucanase